MCSGSSLLVWLARFGGTIYRLTPRAAMALLKACEKALENMQAYREELLDFKLLMSDQVDRLDKQIQEVQLDLRGAVYNQNRAQQQTDAEVPSAQSISTWDWVNSASAAANELPNPPLPPWSSEQPAQVVSNWGTAEQYDALHPLPQVSSSSAASSLLPASDVRASAAPALQQKPTYISVCRCLDPQCSAPATTFTVVGHPPLEKLSTTVELPRICHITHYINLMFPDGIDPQRFATSCYAWKFCDNFGEFKIHCLACSEKGKQVTEDHLQTSYHKNQKNKWDSNAIWRMAQYRIVNEFHDNEFCKAFQVYD